MANTHRRTTSLECSAPAGSPAHLLNTRSAYQSRKPLGLNPSSRHGRIDAGDLVLTRLSKLPDNARPRREHTLVFFSIETPWAYVIHGADRLYDLPYGAAVALVRSKAVLELADGRGNLAIERGIWLAQPR